MAPQVLDACTADGRLDLLKSLSEQLEICQKSLSEYLDTKRCAFPRFFFISDDELLSILGTSDPTSVQVRGPGPARLHEMRLLAHKGIRERWPNLNGTWRSPCCPNSWLCLARASTGAHAQVV